MSEFASSTDTVTNEKTLEDDYPVETLDHDVESNHLGSNKESDPTDPATHLHIINKTREGDAFAAGRKLLQDEVYEDDDHHTHNETGADGEVSDKKVTKMNLASSLDRDSCLNTQFNRAVPMSTEFSSPVTHNEQLAGTPPGSPGPRLGAVRKIPGFGATANDALADVDADIPPLCHSDDEHDHDGSRDADGPRGDRTPEPSHTYDETDMEEYRQIMRRAKEIHLHESAAQEQQSQEIPDDTAGAPILPLKSIFLTGYKKRMNQLLHKPPKTVTFAEGTMGPSGPSLAVGIVKHEHNLLGGYMEYTLQLWQNGRSWTMLKRYSQFKTFQAELQVEYEKLRAEKAQLLEAQKALCNKTDEQLAQIAKFEEMHRRASIDFAKSAQSEELVAAAKKMHHFDDDDRGSGYSTDSNRLSHGSGHHSHSLAHTVSHSGGAMILENLEEEDPPLPELPKKRWFETQRWLNKYDHMYAYIRRQALQDYLKVIVKIPLIAQRSQTLQSFLDLEQTSMNSPAHKYESISGELSRSHSK